MPQRLLILGGGFAAVSLLRKIDASAYDITVVSKRNHFLFTPLLPSSTVGTVEFRSIIDPIRRVNRNTKFIQASAKSLNVEARRVFCREDESGVEFDIEFDLLVVAVGARTNTFNVPGVAEHALFLKELTDARRLRERIIQCLERASVPGTPAEERAKLLHFVVVGGGATGIEFAAELHDLLVENVPRAYPELVGKVKITLFEAMSSVLGGFDESLRDYTIKSFKRRGIEVRLDSPVAEIHAGGLRLQSGEEIPAGTVVWTSGVQATPFVAQLPFKRDRAGRLIVDEFLRVNDHPTIYAPGDNGSLAAGPLPMTAQAAMQQGKYLAKALNRMARNKEVKPFKFNNLGMLAYIGDNRALADIPKAKLRWRGFFTYLFWRSAYLTRLVSFKNKTLVLFDWFKTIVFGRDLSRF